MSESLSEAAGAAHADVRAVISALWVYPVKSCAGVQMPEAILTETGLEFDRAWMVVDERGEFVTQRELPRMALIRPQLKTQDMVLRAPGMLALHIALDQVQEPVRVKVWNDEVQAYDMGAVAAQWFSDFLGAKLRLVRFDPEHKRPSSTRWTGGVQALNQFSDGYPLLVLSEASLTGLNDRLQAAGGAPVTMQRFRPNIVLGAALGPASETLAAHDEDRLDELQVSTDQGVARLKPVKPCARCPIDLPPPSRTIVKERSPPTQENGGHEKKQIHRRADHRLH
ncbi:MAG: MOSC N-terminal beta barrel domain-containing protein, partial [Polaromonas sp.]|uniref:MOSC domain-containing protein n=1 Tax=Polaromonas sp. TaxID=1869339 RepID=UPI00181D4B00